MRCVLTAIKAPKCVFGWGSAPDPAGGAYSTPPDLARFRKEKGLRGEEAEKGYKRRSRRVGKRETEVRGGKVGRIEGQTPPEQKFWLWPCPPSWPVIINSPCVDSSGSGVPHNSTHLSIVTVLYRTWFISGGLNSLSVF